MDYAELIKLQDILFQKRVTNEIGDTMLLTEINPVFTFGAIEEDQTANLLQDKDWYKNEKGIDFYQSDRGGSLTYHAPGQVYCCLIRKNDNISKHIELCQNIMVSASNMSNIKSEARNGENGKYLGTWVEDRKLGFIGLSYKDLVFKHGFVLNVNIDLEPYNWITSCGLKEKVTSFSVESQLDHNVEVVKDNIVKAWGLEINQNPQEMLNTDF